MRTPEDGRNLIEHPPREAVRLGGAVGSGPRVVRLWLRDERVAVASLAAAFADYQLLTSLCPDAARRKWVAHAFCRFLYRTCVRRGVVYATADRAAVACLLPPGSEWPGEWDYVRAGVLSVAWRLGWRPGLWFLRLGPWFDAARHQHMGDRPHWYLHLLGVRPEMQGKGLSRAVLRPAFDAADRDRVPVYLETMPEANVPMYEKLGFALLGTTAFPGGLPNREMRRDPR
jgi:hypothetical protein